MSPRTSSAPNYETVLNAVRTWPATQRFILVQEVLATLAPEGLPASERQPTLPRALGLLATDRPAPSDADIAAWLEERRQERYGL